MTSVATRSLRRLSLDSFGVGLQRVSNKWYSSSSSSSSSSFGSGDDIDNDNDDFIPELQMQGVDPRKGWGFRGVHKYKILDDALAALMDGTGIILHISRWQEQILSRLKVLLV
ncbi:hypothetical protein Tco_1017698 [Tanacetum coccineum]|uniref:Uncharacterized protein n=1 Tax=Tanacetum coccineum TaxID=301880 RepID=A0ABQ5FTN0_9ASTR